LNPLSVDEGSVQRELEEHKYPDWQSDGALHCAPAPPGGRAAHWPCEVSHEPEKQAELTLHSSFVRSRHVLSLARQNVLAQYEWSVHVWATASFGAHEGCSPSR
jgi:hypothetical protein